MCNYAATQTAGASLVLRGSWRAESAPQGPRPPSVRDFTAGARGSAVWPCSYLHRHGLLARFFLQLEKKCEYVSLERYLLKKSLIAVERHFEKPFRRFFFLLIFNSLRNALSSKSKAHYKKQLICLSARLTQGNLVITPVTVRVRVWSAVCKC